MEMQRARASRGFAPKSRAFDEVETLAPAKAKGKGKGKKTKSDKPLKVVAVNPA